MPLRSFRQQGVDPRGADRNLSRRFGRAPVFCGDEGQLSAAIRFGDSAKKPFALFGKTRFSVLSANGQVMRASSLGRRWIEVKSASACGAITYVRRNAVLRARLLRSAIVPMAAGPQAMHPLTGANIAS